MADQPSSSPLSNPMAMIEQQQQQQQLSNNSNSSNNPGIGSPPVDIPQQQQQQLMQQQQNLMGMVSNSFQNQQGMNRPGSGDMLRMNQNQQQQQQVSGQQQQQQFGLLRQQNGMYGNMNFGGSMLNQQLRQQQQQQQQQMQQQQQQQQQTQQQQMGSGNVSRSVLMGGQSGQMPVLQSQTAAQFNISSQLLGSPRQRANILQGSQLQQTNPIGMQTLQQMQMMGFNSQMRANGPVSYGQQRLNAAQLRQQLSQQNTLSSPQGQTLSRNPSLAFVNSQLSALPHNGQPSLMQNSIQQQQQQQQWLKQMPTMSGSVSSSLHLQRQQLVQQKMSQSPQLQQNMNIPLNSQQQQARQLQQQQTQQQQLLSQQYQQHLMQQQSGLSGQKSVSLTGSQPDGTVSGGKTTGGSSNQGTETTNQLLGKRKIQDLVSQVNPQGKLDPEVEDLLLEIADDFIDSVTTFACNLAKHRKSSMLESKDVLLHLEKNWRFTVPGYSSDERRNDRNNSSSDLHRKRLDMVRTLMGSTQSETYPKNSNEITRQDMIKPSHGSDQLVAQSTASQMLQQMTRF